MVDAVQQRNFNCLCLIGAMHMNGDLSPEASADQTQGITETDGGNAEELPPPIPIKKRHM